MGPYLWSDLPSSSRSDEAIKTDGSTRSQGRKAQGGGAFTDEGPHAGNLTFFVPKTNGWNLNIIPQNEKEHQGVYPPVFFGFHLSFRGCS